MPLHSTEGMHAGEFIISEGNGSISRGTGTVLSGENLVAGAVVGKITTTGKYVELNPGATNGSEAAAAILFDAVDASAADTDGVLMERLCEVNGAEITWPTGITANEKDAAIAELAALNILVR